MMRPFLVLYCLFFMACGPAEWQWDLPAHFPEPRVPNDNPMSAAKVELGRHLFYDTRLSVNGRMACASCHLHKKAFTDGKITPHGVTGEPLPRNAMSLVNVAYNSRFTWANSLVNSLEYQALLPLFRENPTEMGLGSVEQAKRDELRRDSTYQNLFKRAFPQDADPFTYAHITKALAAFQRSLISANSPYDRHLAGDNAALSVSAQRGLALFQSERLRCTQCHGGFNFTDTTTHKRRPKPQITYHNTGLYNLNEAGDYPAHDQGLKEITGKAEDMGHYRAPTLRNIAVSGPYFHDGSAKTLEDVIDHYARGGRQIMEGELAGNGAENPLKDPRIAGFHLNAKERQDLLAFFESLTDTAFLKNPAHANPWELSTPP